MPVHLFRRHGELQGEQEFILVACHIRHICECLWVYAITRVAFCSPMKAIGTTWRCSVKIIRQTVLWQLKHVN